MQTSEWKATVKIQGPLSFPTRFTIDGIELRSRSNDIIAVWRIQALDTRSARHIVIRKINDVLDIISFISKQHVEIQGTLNLHSEGKGFIGLPAVFSIRRIFNEENIAEIEAFNTI